MVYTLLQYFFTRKCLLIYLLTAIGLTHGGSSTVHIYTKQYIEQHN